MHKLKIILLFLAGLFVVLLSFFAYILITFDDQDYQDLLVNTVDKFSDYSLSINGQFKLQRTWSPILAASDIKFQSKSNSNHIHLDSFSIGIDLLRLPGGTLLIKDLMLKNMDLDISSEQAKSNTRDLAFIQYLPAPVIEHAELTDIRLKTTGNNILTLTQLTIAANNEQLPLTINGKGQFNNDNFSINGQFGPLAEIFSNNQPYPVMLKIESEHATLTLAGTIDEPSQSEGLNLLLTLKALELSDLLDQKAPLLGHLSAQGQLLGSLNQPELRQIKVLLSNKNLISLQTTGSIENLLTQEGTALQMSGFINDSEVLAWLLPKNTPAINKLKFKTTLLDANEDFALENIDIKFTSTKGIKAAMQGRTRLVDSLQTFHDMLIKATINSPTTEAINPYLGGFLPEMGVVTGSATITSSEQGFLLNEIDIIAGQGEKVQLSAWGDIGPLSTTSTGINMGLDLLLNAKQTADLGSLLNTKFPAIGPIQITSHLSGTTKTITLEELKLQAGSPDLFLLHANGQISWDQLDQAQALQHTDISIKSSAPSFRDAYRLISDDGPDLGAFSASMRIHGTGSVLTGSHVQIQTGNKDTLLVKTQGNISKIFLTDFRQKGIALSGTVSAKSTQQLSRLVDNQTIPDFGSVQGQFNIQGDSNNLSIPHLSLNAGRKQGLLITAEGSIANIPLQEHAVPKGIKINLAASAPNTSVLSIFSTIDTKIPDLGKLNVTGVIEENQGVVAINKLRITTGNPDQPVINMHGSVKNIFAQQGLKIRILFNENLLIKLFNLQKIKQLGHIQGSLLLTNMDNSLGIEELQIKSEKSKILSIKINGQIDDIVRVDEINMNADITIHDLALAGELFNVDLPTLDEIIISGKLRGAKHKAAFIGIVDIGKTRLVNDLSITYNKGIPSITGKISSNDINLPDLGFIQDEHSDEEQLLEPFFSKKPLPLDVLNKINLDLKITTEKISGITYPLEKTSINVVLHSGKLKLAPVKFILSGGQVQLNAEIFSDPTLKSSLSVRSKALKLGTLLSEPNSKPPVEGDLDFIINLTGKGRSAHEIASSLNGEVALMLENGKVRKRELEIIFLNLVGWLFSYGINGNEMIISCGLINYNIVNGIASSMLYINGPQLTARGKGTINLNKETIDTLINMDQKRIIFNKNVPIRLSGSLMNPDVKLVSLTQPILQAGGYIFFPAVTIPVEVLGTVWDIIDHQKQEGGSCSKQILH